jgi:uncharacterized protein (DUF952 family)
MKPDLVFHLVSKRKWKERQKSGYYRPDWKEDEDNRVRCYYPDKIEEIANSQFADRRNILMLVIHTQRIISKVDFDEDLGEVYVDDQINLDAILDKIVLTPNEDGKYVIQIQN